MAATLVERLSRHVVCASSHVGVRGAALRQEYGQPTVVVAPVDVRDSTVQILDAFVAANPLLVQQPLLWFTNTVLSTTLSSALSGGFLTGTQLQKHEV